MPGVLPSNLAITGNQLTDRSSPDTDLSIEDDAGRGKNAVVKSFLRHDLRQRIVGENALLHTLAPSPSDDETEQHQVPSGLLISCCLL